MQGVGFRELSRMAQDRDIWNALVGSLYPDSADDEDDKFLSMLWVGNFKLRDILKVACSKY